MCEELYLSVRACPDCNKGVEVAIITEPPYNLICTLTCENAKHCDWANTFILDMEDILSKEGAFESRFGN